MPNSLRSKLSSLRYKGKITEEEYKELITKLDGHDKELRTPWVPCNERLPEKQDRYLVTIEWKGSCSGDVYIETNMAVYREKPKEWDCKGVIAWMPKPEPYKAESEDKT